MDKFAPYAKALVGAAAAGLAVLAGALDGGVTPAEWIEVALAILGVGGGVYAVPNRKA